MGEPHARVSRRTLLTGGAAAGAALVAGQSLTADPVSAADPATSDTTTSDTTTSDTATSPPDVGRRSSPSDVAPMAARPPLVGISHGNRDYAAATRAAIASAGGLAGIIAKGDSVVIKPNICTEQAGAGSAQITDYRAVQAVIDLAREAGASRIILMEGSITGNPFSKAALAINKYDTLTGVDETVESGNITSDSLLTGIMPPNSQNTMTYYLPKAYLNATKVITVAKLKTHFNAGATLSLKNSFGLAARAKHNGGKSMRYGLHGSGGSKLARSIVDLNLIRMPNFAVLEGIVAGEGDGPLSCTAVDARVILAGQDLVALDTVGVAFMGLAPATVPHIDLARAVGLGITDLTKIPIKGAVLKDIAMTFKPAKIVNPR